MTEAHEREVMQRSGKERNSDCRLVTIPRLQVPETNLSLLKWKSRSYFRDTEILVEPQGRGQGGVSNILEPGGTQGQEVCLPFLSPRGTAKVLESPTNHGIFSAQAHPSSWAPPSSNLALPLTETRSWKCVGWSFHLPSLSSLETGPLHPSEHVSANSPSKMRNGFLGPDFKFPRKDLGFSWD